MKTFEEFYDFYQTHLLPDLTKLEEERIATSQQVLVYLVPYCALLAIIIYMCRNLGDGLGVIIMLGLGGGFGIYYFVTKNYVNNFKDIVIEKLVLFIDINLKYDKSGYIPLSDFTNSKIFLNRADKYEGDDLVTGKIDATSVRFSELHVQRVTRDSKGRRSSHTFFKGLFFVGDFNKHFKGQTFVLTDMSERMLGGLGKMLQKMNFSRPELIKMEDPEFERYYVVYGTDQTEGRYILSTALMKRIMDFRNKTNRKVQLSFVDSNVYVAIPYTKNLFEPKIFRSLLDLTPIKEYFDDLQLAVGIVEDLNLNTRIWTKE